MARPFRCLVGAAPGSFSHGVEPERKLGQAGEREGDQASRNTAGSSQPLCSGRPGLFLTIGVRLMWPSQHFQSLTAPRSACFRPISKEGPIPRCQGLECSHVFSGTQLNPTGVFELLELRGTLVEHPMISGVHVHGVKQKFSKSWLNGRRHPPPSLQFRGCLPERGVPRSIPLFSRQRQGHVQVSLQPR